MYSRLSKRRPGWSCCVDLQMTRHLDTVLRCAASTNDRTGVDIVGVRLCQTLRRVASSRENIELGATPALRRATAS